MAFVSYAQNFEDVMLWRALKEVQNGFYIDVGAAWPEEHSVTLSFYKRGWRGVNIEVNFEHYYELCKKRPHDTNLNLAVGEHAGSMEAYFFAETGLSTLDPKIAEKYQNDKSLVLHKGQVAVETLAAIWAQHVPDNQSVHFLKVDVEGLEKVVLKGNDWSKNRPWIVIAEAMVPMSQEENHASWEPLLLDSEYLFAYADGLNRFYVAKEHEALLDSFKYPPNIFDGFVLASQATLESQRVEADNRANEAVAQRKTAALEVAAQLAETRATTLTVELQKAQLEAVVLARELEQTNLRLAESEQRYSESQARLGEEIEKINVIKIELSRTLYYQEDLGNRVQESDSVYHSKQLLFDELERAKQDLYDMHWCNHNNVIANRAFQNQLEEVYKSTSWKITAPLRWFKRLVVFLFRLPRLLFVTILRYSIAALRWPLAHLMLWTSRRHWVKNRVVAVLRYFPGMQSQLRGIACRYEIVEPKVIIAGEADLQEEVHGEKLHAHSDVECGEKMDVGCELSPKVERIYRDLKAMVDRHKRGDQCGL